MVEITCVLDAKASLGESTFWDATGRALWWIDIWESLIHRFDPATGNDETWSAPEYLGCLALRETGGLVVSMASGFHFFDPASGAFTLIVDPEAHIGETRFNDGKTDRQGRFWSGTVFEAEGREPERIGALYRLDPDLSVHRMVEGIGSSNGLAFSPDSRTMYFADSYGGAVWAFDFDPSSGDLENRRVFIDTTTTGSFADGATVDAEGCYWVTLPHTSKVCRYDPAGRLMQTVMMPTDLPTCCEFGGENLDILYVTTGILRRPDSHFSGQRNPGGLFAVEAGVKGLTLPPFKG